VTKRRRAARRGRSPLASRVACGLGLGLGLGAGQAVAQDLTGQVVGVVSVGFTDNPQSVPDGDPPAGQPAKANDGFVELAPQAWLRYLTPRSESGLGFSFAYNQFFVRTEASSYSGALTYVGRFELGERTTASLGLTSTLGQTNTFNRTGAASGTTGLAVVPGGSELFFNGSLTESIAHELSERTVLLHAGNVSLLQPIPQPPAAQVVAVNRPRTVFAGLSLGLQRTLGENDLGSITLATNGVFTSRVVDEAAQVVVSEPRRQLINTLVLGWQHRFSPGWDSELRLGVLQGNSLGDPVDTLAGAPPENGGLLVEPTGSALVRYQRDEGVATLRYAHESQPVPVLGQNAITDSIALGIALPIALSSRLFFSGSGGYRMSRILTDTGAIAAPIDVISADAALVYTPHPSLGLAVRYQYLDQAIVKALVDEALSARFPVLPFSRHTAMFSISFAYPAVSPVVSPPPLVAPPFRPAPQGGDFQTPGPATPVSTPSPPPGATPGS
jgi:hypothetical protein